MSVVRKTTVYLPPELKEALRQAARKSGESQAELIREGVRNITAEKLGVYARLPLCESGIPNLAENVDEYLDGFGIRGAYRHSNCKIT